MLARTAAALLSVQAITWLSSIIAIVVIPRRLGATELGLLTAITMLCTIMGRVAGLGMTQDLVRQVARDRSQANRIAADAIAWRLLAGVAITVAIALGMRAWGVTTLTLGIFLLVAVTSLAYLVQEVCTSCMQGNYTLGRVAAVTGTVALVTQAAVATSVLMGGGALHVACWGAAGGVTSALLALLVFSRQFSFPRFIRRPGVAVVRSGMPFFSWEVSLLIYGSIDTLMLTLFADNETVGNYALAFRISSIPIFIAVVITSTIYPALSQAHAEGRRSWFADALTRASGLTILATLPIAIGIAVESNALIDITGGSEGYTSSALLLAILVMHLPFAAFDTLQGTSLFARDRQMVLAIAAWGAVGVNVAGNLAAMPLAEHFWGNAAIGCALMKLATELYMFGLILYFVRGTLIPAQLLGWLVRAVALSAAVVAALELANPFGIFVAIPVAGLVYLGLGYLVAGRTLLRSHEPPPSEFEPDPVAPPATAVQPAINDPAVE